VSSDIQRRPARYDRRLLRGAWLGLVTGPFSPFLSVDLRAEACIGPSINPDRQEKSPFAAVKAESRRFLDIPIALLARFNDFVIYAQTAFDCFGNVLSTCGMDFAHTSLLKIGFLPLNEASAPYIHKII
jgi:hypothetical protein